MYLSSYIPKELVDGVERKSELVQKENDWELKSENKTSTDPINLSYPSQICKSIWNVEGS